jgi:hypothetical protein
MFVELRHPRGCRSATAVVTSQSWPSGESQPTLRSGAATRGTQATEMDAKRTGPCFANGWPLRLSKRPLQAGHVGLRGPAADLIFMFVVNVRVMSIRSVQQYPADQVAYGRTWRRKKPVDQPLMRRSVTTGPMFVLGHPLSRRHGRCRRTGWRAALTCHRAHSRAKGVAAHNGREKSTSSGQPQA